MNRVDVMGRNRVVLLYNTPVLPRDHPDAASEFDVLDTVKTVDGILSEGGFEVRRLGVGNDLQPMLDHLTTDRPDAVYNMFEGLADRPFTETVAAGLLEWFNLPFTGSPAETLALCRDKQRVKLMLQGAGLPTAPFMAVRELPVPECPIPWPVIVKPVGQDASVGIEQQNVVTNQKELAERVADVADRYGWPVLIEQFISGREFLVTLVECLPDVRAEDGLLALPFSEIEFKNPTFWPIYTYTAKWAEDSEENVAAPVKVGVDLPKELRDRIVEVCRQAYRLFGCRDYARVDLRVDEAGRPFLLEVNPNPYVSSQTLTEGLSAISRSHSEFVCSMMRAALARGPLTP